MQAGTTQIPGFGQLYILDPVEAMEQRRNNPTFTGEKITSENELVQGHELNEKTLDLLEQMIQAHHPAAEAYKQAHEQLKELLKQQSPDELRFFRMTLLDQRRPQRLSKTQNSTFTKLSPLLRMKGCLRFTWTPVEHPRQREFGLKTSRGN